MECPTGLGGEILKSKYRLLFKPETDVEVDYVIGYTLDTDHFKIRVTDCRTEWRWSLYSKEPYQVLNQGISGSADIAMWQSLKALQWHFGINEEEIVSWVEECQALETLAKLGGTTAQESA